MASTALFLNVLVIHIVLAGGLPPRLSSSLCLHGRASSGLPQTMEATSPRISLIGAFYRYPACPYQRRGESVAASSWTAGRCVHSLSRSLSDPQSCCVLKVRSPISYPSSLVAHIVTSGTDSGAGKPRCVCGDGHDWANQVCHGLDPASFPPFLLCAHATVVPAVLPCFQLQP
ncbi:hypothetical protein LXA43DRAFT_1000393 [Ganoderma leucocontextum]|nr:hypothetical protein LXA43DRAFT_1000393 [Ganoderma leucocontextum]